MEVLQIRVIYECAIYSYHKLSRMDENNRNRFIGELRFEENRNNYLDNWLSIISVFLNRVSIFHVDYEYANN